MPRTVLLLLLAATSCHRFQPPKSGWYEQPGEQGAIWHYAFADNPSFCTLQKPNDAWGKPMDVWILDCGAGSKAFSTAKEAKDYITLARFFEDGSKPE